MVSRKEQWTKEKNGRRCDLIDKEIDGIILSDEQEELSILQKEMREYVNRVAPLPIEDARQLHKELLAKAKRNK